MTGMRVAATDCRSAIEAAEKKTERIGRAREKDNGTSSSLHFVGKEGRTFSERKKKRKKGKRNRTSRDCGRQSLPLQASLETLPSCARRCHGALSVARRIGQLLSRADHDGGCDLGLPCRTLLSAYLSKMAEEDEGEEEEVRKATDYAIVAVGPLVRLWYGMSEKKRKKKKKK